MRRLKFAAAVLPVCLTMLSGPAIAEQVRVAHFFAQDSVIAETDQGFADELAEKTDLELEIFWAGAMGGGKEILALVSGGAVQMGATVPSYYPSELPVASVGSSPLFYYVNPQQALEVTRTIVSDDPAGKAEMERLGIEPLVIHTAAPYRLVCNKPVETVADMDGLKIRTFSAISTKAMSAVGAVPVSMGSGEVYEALQRGTIDCAMYNNEFSVARKLHEVAKYWSTVSFGAISGTQLFANKAFMDSLPEDVAETVRAAGRQAEEAELEKVLAADKEAAEIAKEAGVTFVEFKEQAQLEEAMPDTLELWVKEITGKGVAQEDADRLAGVVRKITGN